MKSNRFTLGVDDVLHLGGVNGLVPAIARLISTEADPHFGRLNEWEASRVKTLTDQFGGIKCHVSLAGLCPGSLGGLA